MQKKYTRKVGLFPGTPVYVGEERTSPVAIRVLEFSEDSFREKVLQSVQECETYRDRRKVFWLNLDGVHNIDIIKKIGKCFDLHPLLQEDIANTQHRPNVEDFGSYIFLAMKVLTLDPQKRNVHSDHVSFILGRNYVLSFQERPGDIFEPIKERLADDKGGIRAFGPDYLVYALIDIIVDQYFLLLENYNEQMEILENAIIRNPGPEALQKIHKLKREMISVRRAIWPLREIIASLEKFESAVIAKKTQFYFRDIYDHVIHILDSLSAYRDTLSGLTDIYLSSVSNRMNAIMKVLTVIATIFIPLTFITGIYGMNFEHMPELESQWGYPAVLFFMFLIGIGMLVYFKKKRWF